MRPGRRRRARAPARPRGAGRARPLPDGHYRVVVTVDDAPADPDLALGRALATGQLDGYEQQRRPVAQRVVAFTDRMTRIATTRNRFARAARNIALPILGHLGLRTKIAAELAELTYPVDLRDSATPRHVAPAVDPADGTVRITRPR